MSSLVSSYSNEKGPKWWGKHWWFVLHSACAHYNPNKAGEREKMIKFLSSFVEILICEICREHAIKNVSGSDVENSNILERTAENFMEYLDSAFDLFYWSYTLHAHVTEQIIERKDDHPRNTYTPSFEEALQFYFSGVYGDDWKNEIKKMM